MEHLIEVSRAVKGLGHPNAARLIRQAAVMALDAERVDVTCYISVMLTDDPGIREINAQYRGVDRATDVLSFPLNELEPGAFDPDACERDLDSGAVLLGDMMISIPRCEEQGDTAAGGGGLPHAAAQGGQHSRARKAGGDARRHLSGSHVPGKEKERTDGEEISAAASAGRSL